MSPHAESTTRRPFLPGVYCPLITPFHAGSEDINFPAFEAQVVRLAKAGMGIVLLGTNGEASHLSDAERAALVRSARSALDTAGFTRVPLLVGTGTGSAKETIRLTQEAKDAGADYSIVIHPGYFAFGLAKNRQAVMDFFKEVLDKSPLNVMIYNFPGAASGIDLDSDQLIELSEHQNCFGAKLTCAGIGKGHRLSAHTQSEAYIIRHPLPFHVLPGYSDYLLPALVARATGCITGTGNLIPKTIVKLYQTSLLALSDPSHMPEALALQDLVAEADWTVVKAGIGGTKWAMDRWVGEGAGGVPRKPLPVAGEDVKEMLEKGLKRAMAYESSL